MGVIKVDTRSLDYSSYQGPLLTQVTRETSEGEGNGHVLLVPAGVLLTYDP